MAIDKIFNNSSIDDLADNVLSEVDDFMLSVEKMQKRKVAGNVQLVIQALKKIDNDIREKYDGVTTVIEKRVSTIKDGKDGQNGANGRDGKDGRPGRDGAVGPRGVDGLNGSNGRDGEDGVSVTNAFIDFDGSLVINLSDGQSLNVGEVVAPDLAEKIKVITNGGGTSQGVLDTLTSLQNQINLISSALVYKGTWNASTNTPALASGVGTANSFYIVSVAGTTTLNGISNWGVGDWATFNGTAWQRVEGGAAGNFTDLTASGTVTLSAGEANGVAFLNGSKVLSSSSFFTYNDSTGISLLRALNQSGDTSFTGTTNIGSSVGTSTANPFFQFQGRNDWPFPQILRFQADYVSGADSGMGLTISSRIGNGTFQNRYQLLADGTAHIWSLGASGSEQMRLTSTTLSLVNNPTLSGGTANGVAYLNGSKVLTSGSALTFDGTNLAIGASPTFYGGQVATSGSIAITGGSLLKLWNTGGTGVGGISSPGTDTIAFGIGSSFTEQMRLTSTGLGIGTSSPAYKLDVNGAARVNNLLWFTPSSGLMAIGASGTNFNIYNGPGAETRLTIDSSGNLGLGVTPQTWNSSYKAIQVYSQASVSATSSAVYFSNNFYQDAGGTNRYIATGAAGVAGWEANIFRWYQAASGSANAAQTTTNSMTLDASGNLLIGTTADGAGIGVASRLAVRVTNGYAAILRGQTVGNAIVTAWNSTTTGDGVFHEFGTETSYTARGTISYNRAGGLVAYNTTSDYRAKDIYGPVADSGALIDSVPVYMGKMKGATQERPMFIAHEVPAYAHTGVKDAVDKDGKPVYQQMDASALIPVMWAEIQSLRQRLAAAGI